MQIEPSPRDPHPCDRRVSMLEWMPKQAMATPSRWLPRSASARADLPSPFSSNPAHQPVVSMPTTPSAAAGSSFGCMTAAPTDSPPVTPKVKAAPATMSAFAAFWSPRRLMQRAARAFRNSRSRRRIKFDEPAPVASGASVDAASAGSMDVEHGSSSDGNNNGGAATDDKMTQEPEQRHHIIEIVPEKIIHETNHQPPPTPVANDAEACERTTADGKENCGPPEKEEEEEEPIKKGGAVPEAEEPVVVDNNVDDMVADKFCVVVKAAMMMKKKHEDQETGDTKKEAMRRFQGSRVKTAMEARAETEQPRRREVARSNEVIEEACNKFLAKRQGSRVRALVGAFETVMDAKPAAVIGNKHHYRKSV